MFNNLQEFYRSKEWEEFRKIVIAERVKDDGFVYDEVTERPIVKAYDIILHHKIELTEENVHDFSISLNPENIMIVSHKTHNAIHNKLGYSVRQVFLVYGAPCAGKKRFVYSTMNEGDLVVDMDSIWATISGCNRYVKPNRLKAIAFRTRDMLLDCVKYRVGKWNNAYIIGGYPLQSERERLCKDLGAREVFIEATEAECLARLEQDEDRKNVEGYDEFVRAWFRQYIPPISGDF